MDGGEVCVPDQNLEIFKLLVFPGITYYWYRYLVCTPTVCGVVWSTWPGIWYGRWYGRW